MDQPIVPLINAKLATRRPQVPLLVEVAPDQARISMTNNQRKYADVKLALADQERSHDVALQDAVAISTLTSAVLSMATELLHMRLYFVIVIEDPNAVATVSRLARLEYPELPLAFALLAGGPELFELGVQLEVRRRWDQISLWHIVEDVQAFRLIVRAHVEEQQRFLRYLVDPINVIVDLVGLQLSQNTRPPHLRPDEIQHFRALTAPSMLLAQLLRIVPAAAFDD